MTLIEAQDAYTTLYELRPITVRNPHNGKIFIIERYQTKWGFYAYRVKVNGHIARGYSEIKYTREQMVDWLIRLDRVVEEVEQCGY